MYGKPTEAATGFRSVRVTRHFKWEATYKKPEEQPGCYCECCEFLHIIMKSVYKFTPTDAGSATAENAKKALPPEETNVTSPREDTCTFVVKEDGEWKQTHDRRNWTPSDPNAKKGVDWDGPFCYGDRDRPAGVPPGCPKKLEPPRTRPDACRISASDNPGRGIPFGHDYTWTWMSIGIVFDTCIGRIAAAKYVWWSIKGSVPWPPAEPSFDDGPNGHDYKAQGEVKFPEGT